MKDGVVWRALKRVALWDFHASAGLRRAFLRRRGGIPYELGGGCPRCARCCEEPGINRERMLAALETARVTAERRARLRRDLHLGE